MESHPILEECRVQFSQMSKGQAVLERKLDRVSENVSNLAVQMAAIRAHQENHLSSQGKSIDRVWRVLYVLIGTAVGGGSAAGIITLL